MKSRNFKMFAGLMAAALCAGVLSPATVRAEGFTGWKEEDGVKYWYENDVKQGTEGRGKEIYDPASDAWYWLDAVDGGKMAVSKDVYQESESGIWGDNTNAEGVTTGKWVRYDENGHMVKGWAGDYYFDQIFGTMAKGYATIEGKEYYFNKDTGVKEQELGEVPENGWKEIDGNWFWYENGIRQGYSVKADYRGKEIYDPASDAWYWLDNVDGGKKAVSKDVYQESKADDEGTIGKWVRYDENGHMVKGWNEKDGNKYYFDLTYGTMVKGYAVIDGKNYYFNQETGVCEGEVKVSDFVWRNTAQTTYYDDGKADYRYVWEYDAAGNNVRDAYYTGNKSRTVQESYVSNGQTYTYDTTEWYSDDVNQMTLSSETLYEYDGNGNQTKEIDKEYSYNTNDAGTEIVSHYLVSEVVYTFNGGDYAASAIAKSFDQNGKQYTYGEMTYNANGDLLKEVVSLVEGSGMKLYYTWTKDYDGNGYLVKSLLEYADGSYKSETTYENDANGNVLKEITYYNGEKTSETRYTYSGNNLASREYVNVETGEVTSRTEYDYDANGNRTEYRNFYQRKINNESKLVLTGKTTYTYDANGNEIGSNQYSYSQDYTTGETKEYHVGYSVTTYVERPNYKYAAVKDDDNWYGHYTMVDGKPKYNYSEGENWAYSSGYSYEYDATTGALTKYVRYTSDENYQKVMSRYTTYATHTFPKAVAAGDFDEYTYSETFDKDGKRTSYMVMRYETVAR